MKSFGSPIYLLWDEEHRLTLDFNLRALDWHLLGVNLISLTRAPAWGSISVKIREGEGQKLYLAKKQPQTKASGAV